MTKSKRTNKSGLKKTKKRRVNKTHKKDSPIKKLISKTLPNLLVNNETFKTYGIPQLEKWEKMLNKDGITNADSPIKRHITKKHLINRHISKRHKRKSKKFLELF
uniref:Uncharacterized protein n=1 Tax=viral metagenome TaxID=1070528 RepID=A0A6C0IRZ5_9ZZZZ